MDAIQFKIITDPDECFKYWEMLSFKEGIFDEWVFRNAYFKLNNFPLFFILGEISGQPIGLLPLQNNTEKGYLEYYGGYWMEDNKVFVKPEFEQYIPEFYYQIDQPAKLLGINQDNDFTKQLPVDGYRFRLDISNYTCYMDYVADKFESSTQHKFRKRIRHIEDHEIEIVKNNFADIDILFEYSKKVFGTESSFYKSEKMQFYREMVKLDLDKLMYTIVVDGKKQAVSLCFKYKDIFYAINSGVNRFDIPDLNSYLTLIKIEEAIKLGCKSYDALMGSYGWKEEWHFGKTPFYKFLKDVPAA